MQLTNGNVHDENFPSPSVRRGVMFFCYTPRVPAFFLILDQAVQAITILLYAQQIEMD